MLRQEGPENEKIVHPRIGISSVLHTLLLLGIK
jgi:hypothetical protein